ncbi:hypothetical protein HDV03_005398 [Kappamyces sp. JEL0829]|nr:hypothetical protein HDV03_005398 [Kappamyces sp. JEL0829]
MPCNVCTQRDTRCSYEGLVRRKRPRKDDTHAESAVDLKDDDSDKEDWLAPGPAGAVKNGGPNPPFAPAMLVSDLKPKLKSKSAEAISQAQPLLFSPIDFQDPLEQALLSPLLALARRVDKTVPTGKSSHEASYGELIVELRHYFYHIVPQEFKYTSDQTFWRGPVVLLINTLYHTCIMRLLKEEIIQALQEPGSVSSSLSVAQNITEISRIMTESLATQQLAIESPFLEYAQRFVFLGSMLSCALQITTSHEHSLQFLHASLYYDRLFACQLDPSKALGQLEKNL